MPRLENPKWEKFAQEYAKEPNGARAYRKAGYSPRTDDSAMVGASRLLRYDKVSERITELQKEAETAAVADVTEIMEYLTRGVRGELTEEVIVVEGDGNGMSSARKRQKQIGIRDRNKCAELMMKRLGMMQPDVQVTVNTPVFVDNGDALED